MSFPGSIPSYTTPTAGETLAVGGHTALHIAEEADIAALGTKIGTGSSTPTSGMLLRGTGAGTSTWAQANLTSDVAGVLPQASGGTGTTLATGTGKAVYDTSPTISGAQLTSSPILTTPTITDFTNANHNHQNVAGGGTLSASAITGVSSSVLSNSYKFRVYLSADQTTASAGGFYKVNFDTRSFDTGSNVDIVTNKGRFTAPIAGFYLFTATVQETTSTNDDYHVTLYKNGVQITGGGFLHAATGTTKLAPTVIDVLQLSASDYVETYGYTSNVGGTTFKSSALASYFSGFLVSAT